MSWRRTSFTDYSLLGAVVYALILGAVGTAFGYWLRLGDEYALDKAVSSGAGFFMGFMIVYVAYQIKRWGDARADHWHGREMRVHGEDE